MLAFIGRAALAAAMVASLVLPAHAEGVAPRPHSAQYQALQKNLARGWNTFNTSSVLSHVLMPDGLAISLGLKPTWKGGKFLGEALRGNRRTEVVKLGARTDDGRYTSLDLEYEKLSMRVESATDGEDVVLLVTPAKSPPDRQAHLTVDVGLLWGRPGTVGRAGDGLVGRTEARSVSVGVTAPLVVEPHAPLRSPYLAVALAGEVGVFSGRARSLADIKQVIARGRAAQQKDLSRWKELAEPFAAMQSALAWNIVYEAEKDRVISPVSRNWSLNFGGWVLFDWDTYFAAAMYSLHNKPLAYANAVEITKSITPKGFIPNYASAYESSWDRSQPPVGSRVVLEIYKRHRERWFLEEVYDELLAWNRWWPKARANGPYLSWATDLLPGKDVDKATSVRFAKFESGLDNAPMFDGVPFKPGTAMFELGDVGLTSLYVMDCDALAEIAKVLARPEAKELRARGDSYRKVVQSMWSEPEGIFLDRRTDTGKTSAKLAPTHFYPLLARAATPQQAARMMKDHYFNPREFHGEFVMPSISRNDPAFPDNDYWRGRIWAPLNYLVYLGMRNYDVAAARKDLVTRSRNLLLKSWRESGAVYENYNGTTGVGGDVRNADSFYHWGALLGFISFIERGDLPKPEAPAR